MTSRGRSAASASRRASGVVRSRIIVPSRWSSSCCTIARGRSFEVVRDLLPVRVAPFDPHRGRPLDGHRHALNGKTAFLVQSRFVAAPDDLRIDEHGHLVLIRAKTNTRRSTPTWVAASPTPFASFISSPRRVASRFRSSSNSSTGGAFIRRTGVWVLADLGERELPPGLALGLELGIELFVPDLFYLGHLRHRLRCRHQDGRALLARPSAITGPKLNPSRHHHGGRLAT